MKAFFRSSRWLALALMTWPDPTARAQSTINPTEPFAWAGNIGWTNWRPSAAGGAVIGRYVCSGHVFCANVGWVNVGSGAPADGIRYSNTAAGDYGVNVLDTTTPGIAALRGFAYGANIGWINFENLGNPRLDLTNGKLSGYAWSANCGWINLASGTTYGVTTSTIAPAPDTDSDGIADAFELLYFTNLATAAATSDADSDGATDRDEALAGSDPHNPDDRLRILSIELFTDAGSDNATLTFTSNPARLYSIEQISDLAPGADTWTDSGLGLFVPDGAITSRFTSSVAAQRRFYRVRAVEPLAP